MNFLVDTSALSDPTYPRPNAGLRRWYLATPETRIHISVLSIGEIRNGVTRLENATRAAKIGAWLDDELLVRFDGRILALDIETCNVWGALCGDLRRRGRPKSVLDSLMAATAIVHGLALVTRNVKDFSGFGIDLINPWQ